MAARVTVAEVQSILPSNSITDAVITSFISGATALVDSVLGSSTEVSTDLKKEIERWLTAHMVSSTLERQAKTEGAGGASITYTGEFGSNLSSTSYGQMVLALDPTGKMAGLGKKGASMYAVTSFS